MANESQIIEQLNDTLKTLNDIGALGIVLITGLVAAVGLVLWIYVNRNRGKGEEAIQQSIASIATTMASQMSQTVQQQSTMVADVARMTAAALDGLNVIRPESADTNKVVHRIEDGMMHEGTGITDILLVVQRATDQNSRHLNAIADDLRLLKQSIDTFVAQNPVRASEIDKLREIMDAAGAVLADIKAAQKDLRRAAEHTAHLATGEHAAVTNADKTAA